jgi:hypothetical protein
MTTSPNRLLGVIVGALYILIGALGFTVTSGVGFFSTEGGVLLGIFEVNVFHNVVHVLIGAALVIAGLSNTRAASTVNSIVGAVFLVLGLAGLFLVGTALNIFAINVADNVLHFGTAAVLLAVGLGADRGGADKRGADQATGIAAP